MREDQFNEMFLLHKALLMSPDGTKRAIAHGYTHLNEIKEVNTFINWLSRSKIAPRFAYQGERMVANRLGRKFMHLLGTDIDAIKRSYPDHIFSPGFEAFCKAVGSLRQEEKFGPLSAEALQYHVRQLQAYVKSPPFQSAVNYQGRGSRKNYAGLTKLIDALFESYSKLLVVRLDLGFRKSFPFGGQDDFHPTFEEVRGLWRQMLKFFRKRLKPRHLVGYAWKIEHAPDKGMHVHALLFFNGQEVSRDVQLAQMIGEYWAHQVTGGRGVYFNCKKEEYKYRGIGMIAHHDLELRKGLAIATAYLTKLDDLVSLVLPKGAKAFGKSAPPAGGHSGLGRPRMTIRKA